MIFKSIISLLSGNIVAQIIYMAFLPLIVRIYDTESIGIFGSSITIINILAILLTMRLELTIIEKDNKELSINSIFLFVSIMAVAILPLSYFILVKFMNFSDNIGLLISFGAIFLAIYQTVNNIYLSNNKYKTISYSNVLKVLTLISFQILLYSFFKNEIVSLLTGYIFSLFIPLFIFKKSWFDYIKKYKYKLLYDFIVCKIDTIKYAGGQALLNMLSQSILYLILPIFFGYKAIGLFYIADKMFRAPLMLIGNPIRQVFLKHSHDESNIKNLYKLYWKLIYFTAIPMFFLTILLFSFGENIFSNIFGNDYAKAGLLAAWLSIWGIGSISSFPALSYLRAIDQNKFIYQNELYFLAIKVILVIAISYYFNNLIIVIAFFSIISLIMACMVIFKADRCLRESIKNDL